jgi:hypothetical protein
VRVLCSDRVCLVCYALQLLLVPGRAMDAHAKHELDWLGLVRVLELLVCYEGHHEAWLERSRHGLGCQGRAVKSECYKGLH